MSRADRRFRRAARWRRVANGRALLIGIDPRVQDALLDAAELGVLPLRRGEVTHVRVLHDDDCPHLVVRDGRRGRCQCRPDVVPPARDAA